MKWVFLVLFLVLIAFSIKDELDKGKNEELHKTDQGPDKYDASGEI